MSIRRKLFIFTSIIVIVPMLTILLLSNIILDNQIKKAAQGYLGNAFIIANNLMVNRLEEMKKVLIKTTSSSEFIREVEQLDAFDIKETLGDMRTVYDYIDFYIVYDGDKNVVANYPDIKNPKFERLNALMDKVKDTHSTVVSEENFSLDDLFYKESEEYNKFRIPLINSGIGNKTGEYLTRCLTEVGVAPVYDKEKGRQTGYVVIGSIINNDDYFPELYSKSVENSFLAISVDGIRIATNIESPKKENFIGSPIPVSKDTLNELGDKYFGEGDFDGEVHVFQDQVITNCDGESVGAIGVGIPKQKFSIILNTQRSIVIIVSAIFLIIMIFVSRYVATKITKPIIRATELANQVSQGYDEITIDENFLESSNDETTVLLKSLKKMADDLRKSKIEMANYVEELENEHSEQQRLSKQLILLNETLEEKVKLRTQDLREAVESLKKSGEVKSQFLANMSHELRTPLSAIINCSGILKEEMFGSLNEKQHKYVSNILDSGNHLIGMINNVLDISKIEAGKMTLVLGDYSVSNIVSQSMSIVKSLAYRKNIDIAININQPDLIIRVDANKLKQILCNLLSNSIKFTPTGGRVTVDVVKSGYFMQLNIKDNGIGIRKEDQERIFNEFEQVDSSYEREYEGTGLGLPLTKKLVELHGGHIYLLSQPGKGTEVIVYLPVNIDEDEGRSLNA